MNQLIVILVLSILLITFIYLNKSSIKLNTKDNGINVNVENFVIAETHMYMTKFFERITKVNTFYHYRNFDTDNAVVRMNLDTLYSIAIMDPKQDDIKLIIPEVKDRYISSCVLDKEHYEVLFTNKGGTYNFPKEQNYLVCLIRILVKDITNKDEIKEVNKIQDNIYISSNNYSDKLILPKYDLESYKYTKSLIKKLFETSPTMSSVGMFGKKNEVNELKHILGVNMGWGGLSEKQAYYESIFPENNNGNQEYSITFKDIPVKAFWSFIVYDKYGFIFPGDKQSLNNFTAKPNSDGSYTINFSNDPQKINQLKIKKGWNFTIRMYEPEEEILQKKWTFPELKKEK